MATPLSIFLRTTYILGALMMYAQAQPTLVTEAPNRLIPFNDDSLKRNITGSHLIPFDTSDEPSCAGTGTILHQTWTDIYGTRISSIPSLLTPDATGELPIFEAPTNAGDNFGSRLSGYLCVPVTGDYTFWIASDDHAELWLSPDEEPNHSIRIANVWGWTTPRQWDKYPTQQSSPIHLIAGQRYYIHALYKEDEGADNLAVGWQLPDGTMERPIPGHRLTPYRAPEGNPCASAGIIRQEFWIGVTGTRVSEIPLHTTPDFIHDLSIFEGPETSAADNYGTRIRGYICPPASGEYTFWIAGDDQTELWLSSDVDPSRKTRIAYHTGWTARREWTKYATQQSAPIILAANQPYYIEALMKEGTGADHISVGWQLPNGVLQRPISAAHLIPFPLCSSAGTILLETWTDIYDTRVSSIPRNTTPDAASELPTFEVPSNAGDNFGSRVSGYLCVPVTGDYTFWIASDDHGELWLSPDDQRNHRVRIANVWGWTRPREWNKYATQQSSPIHLIAHRRYYIEAVYKEDEGADHMAVGWQLPDGTMERPIPGNRLSPFDAVSSAAPRTAIQEERYSQIGVYPNPVKSGEMQLTLTGYEDIPDNTETHIEIINMTGEVVFSHRIGCGGNCNTYVLNINKQLVPGVYLVHTKTNAYRSLKRLVVK